MKAIATYQIAKWAEEPYASISNEIKLTKTSATFVFSGHLQGNATVEYLMYYGHFEAKNPYASSADYVGLIQFVGRLNGRMGTFVMEDRGTFREGVSTSVLKIIPQSGMNDLEGIFGTGQYTANSDGCEFELNFEYR